MPIDLERLACIPQPLDIKGLNRHAVLPYGVKPLHVFRAMENFLDFLGFVNKQLYTKGMGRLESFLMPANFSSIVSELMTVTIPKHCTSIVKNHYHNGHPDLLPAGVFSNDSVQYTNNGIEVKASRYMKAWQGHNPEDIWLLVVVFDSNRPRDPTLGVSPKPFRFNMVLCAKLAKSDWKFAGRSEASRRTITASVTESGYQKLMTNWIYKSAELLRAELGELI